MHRCARSRQWHPNRRCDSIPDKTLTPEDTNMNLNRYMVLENEKVDLGEYPTGRDAGANRKEIENKRMPENLKAMADLQERLFADNRYALLIVLQAMDAAGKDGIIKHVMTGLNPQGVKVASFKAPSSEENDHDYLWRIHKAIPPRGEIGIFNRSHYEDVLVARVHDLIQGSQIPEELVGQGIWSDRYSQIRSFETHLTQNGYRIIKFFLHVSKEEQRERLLDRINQEDKHWKFSSGDIEERAYWGEYMHAYEIMLQQTSTRQAPWYVIPADNKWYARYLVSQAVRQALEEINPQYPALAPAEKDRLDECRALLESQAPEKQDKK